MIVPPQTTFNILIVDDVKDNLLALNALLQSPGITVLQARSGDEALELMMRHDFCLALLDVQMPNMNGFELAELMRGSNKTKNIPIIFVTAVAKHEKYIFRGYETGAVDFLFKPVDPHILKSKVNVFLELYHQREELKRQVDDLKEAREFQTKLLDELHVTKGHLEKAVHVMEEFMSIAGHEFKTPLTSLKLQVELRLRLLNRGDTAPFERDKLSTMFESDKRQLERLSRLIDDMLDVSRINSGHLSMKLENFDLSALVNDIVERNLGLFSAAGSDIEVDSSISINGNWDKFRIEQVITNLITNAVRYGAGKLIKIATSVTRDNAIVVITDKGIGIAAENIERIFKRFERATGTANVSGLGLGLYIVSQIIVAHNGLISVESRLGEGSVFTIKLPLLS
ncbi:MAG TPA: ATP-binding protein [Bacteriovoracaceae bacterium]|nr:ATP-binding protein [Bacteriovoracaceae bacterium]